MAPTVDVQSLASKTGKRKSRILENLFVGWRVYFFVAVTNRIKIKIMENLFVVSFAQKTVRVPFSIIGDQRCYPGFRVKGT